MTRAKVDYLPKSYFKCDATVWPDTSLQGPDFYESILISASANSTALKKCEAKLQALAK